MFKTIFLSDLKYSLKQPMVYVFFFIVALLTFGATVSDMVQIGGAVGNVYKNAPSVITTHTMVLSLFGLLFATAFFNNAALRDYSCGFQEILFSTPLSKSGYFYGRFFSALLLSTLPMLGVFFGIWLGTIVGPAAGWIDAERFGPFFLHTFLSNYFLIVVPNMLLTGIIIYAMATKWKNTVISFLGTVVIIVVYMISLTLLSDLDNENLGAMMDFFGVSAQNIESKYYTVVEKNTLSISFSGVVAKNRLIWLTISIVLLLLTAYNFSFQIKGKKVKKERKKRAKVASRNFTLPEVHPSFSKATEWLHFKSFFTSSLLRTIKSPTYQILFGISTILTISTLWGGFEYYGLKSYPLTYKMIDAFANNSFMFNMIVMIFFSGELVWQDREHKFAEVVDATPHTSFVSLLAKGVTLLTSACILHFWFILCSIVYQLFNGYYQIELDVYIIEFCMNALPRFFCYGALVILIQVLVKNRYIGYFISILFFFALDIVLSVFDINSRMVAFASFPVSTYSDMNGFGDGIYGTLLFVLYWSLFSMMLFLFAGSLWSRGMNASLIEQLKHVRKNLPRAYRTSFSVLGVAWIAVAGFVYYNTQVLNSYHTVDETREYKANYEKKYKKYEDVAHLNVMSVKYFVDIFPYKQNLDARAEMVLKNETELPIDSLHFTVDEDWNQEILIPNATLVYNDEEYGYQIYTVSPAIQPGEAINAEMKASLRTKGFGNSSPQTSVVSNGTFVNNLSFLPTMGYVSSMELSSKNTRKKYDLAPKARMPKLNEDREENCKGNYVTDDYSAFIPIETVVSTASDQLAVAPGSLMKEWKENGRNYYHYKVDVPSLNFLSISSARYEVKRRKWNDVDIEVYYDQKHGKNVELMLDAVQRSLEYYTKHFGPYYHKQCRIIEFPRYATFAQAFPGTMPYSESIGFVANLEEAESNNVVDKVIAHEMSHQYWAHQVVGPSMQGSTMFSESFAEYSALMTMKSIAKTNTSMRDFLKYEHNNYLRNRGSEQQKELPLLKDENQQYIHYMKGSVVMYALQDYIGEEKMNHAMKSFLEEYRYKTPYPTATDFMEYLEPQVPDSLNYLITDWIENITLYDNRLKQASYEELENGKYRVSMNVEARKLRSDSLGIETPIEINDWIDIGAFADSDFEELIYEQRVKIDKESMTFSFDLDTIPAKLAIDPRHLLIDRIYSDNSKTASRKES